MRYAAVLALLVFAAVNAEAAVKTETIGYKVGDKAFEGYLAYDDALSGTRPGVLVVHEWWGLDDYAKSRARQIAELGYVAFAVDMYGKGVLAKSPDEAGKLAGALRGGDRKAMRERINAALDVLRANGRTDPARVAAIGYCFGGTTVLELAKSGADVRGVVSFHGGLDAPDTGDARGIKGSVLVLHGADDQFVPPAQVQGFMDEMRKGGVDWQFVQYGGAVHGFTRPDGDRLNIKGYGYNAKADRRSWEAMKVFFDGIFK